MFQFPAFASNPYVFEGQIPCFDAWNLAPPRRRSQSPIGIRQSDFQTRLPTAQFRLSAPTAPDSQASKVGFPIRRSMDQSSFAAPHGLSQRITSFFACACQGIHQMPLLLLIVLIANAHHLSGLAKLSFSLPLEGQSKPGHPGTSRAPGQTVPR